MKNACCPGVLRTSGLPFNAIQHHAMLFSKRLVFHVVNFNQSSCGSPGRKPQQFHWCFSQVPAEPKSAWIQGGDAVGKPRLCWMNGWFFPGSGGKTDSPGWWPFFGDLDKWKLKLWFQNCCYAVHLCVWWLMVFDGWCSCVSKTWEMVSIQEMKQWSLRMRTWNLFDCFCSWSWCSMWTPIAVDMWTMRNMMSGQFIRTSAEGHRRWLPISADESDHWQVARGL